MSCQDIGLVNPVIIEDNDRPLSCSPRPETHGMLSLGLRDNCSSKERNLLPSLSSAKTAPDNSRSTQQPSVCPLMATGEPPTTGFLRIQTPCTLYTEDSDLTPQN